MVAHAHHHHVDPVAVAHHGCPGVGTAPGVKGADAQHGGLLRGGVRLNNLLLRPEVTSYQVKVSGDLFTFPTRAMMVICGWPGLKVNPVRSHCLAACR